MGGLTKLQLDNNIICKIEGIEHLTQLKWLDLSFNMITKMENLEALVNLTDLTLYSNHITEIGNLETLTELNVFSFGKNEVKDYEASIKYLRGLKNKLQVLNMADNPYVYASQSEKDYKYHTICMLKNLKYLDYELITQNMKENAQSKW